MEVHKAGLPFLNVQVEPDAWRIESATTGRSRVRSGPPSSKIVWLQLAQCLSDLPPGDGWIWRENSDGTWSLETRHTGERMEGFVTQ